MYHPALKTFLVVADCGSFTKASEKLYISPTAIMKQINSLESELDMKLFTRTSQGVRLTPAGESIYKDGKYLISYSDQAIKKAKSLINSQTKLLRVGTSLLNPCKAFMDIWNLVNNLFPQFQIQIVPFEDTQENILSVIGAIGQKIDFLVGACDSAQWLKLCQIYPLGEYTVCCAVAYTHRLAQKERLEIIDLYGERLMMVKKGDSPHNDQIRENLSRYHPQIHIEDTPQFYDIGIFNRCQQTGNVLLTLDTWADVHPSVKTIPVNWDYTIPYGLLYPLHPSKNVTEFLDALKESIPQAES